MCPAVYPNVVWIASKTLRDLLSITMLRWQSPEFLWGLSHTLSCMWVLSGNLELQLFLIYYVLRIHYHPCTELPWYPVGWRGSQCPVDYIFTESQSCCSQEVKQYRWIAFLRDDSKLFWYSLLIGIENKVFIRLFTAYQVPGSALICSSKKTISEKKTIAVEVLFTWWNLRESIAILQNPYIFCHGHSGELNGDLLKVTPPPSIFQILFFSFF